MTARESSGWRAGRWGGGVGGRGGETDGLVDTGTGITGIKENGKEIEQSSLWFKI